MRIKLFNLSVLTFTPLLAIYGLFTTPWTKATLIFASLYYFLNMLGITAGYHRLWSHRSYVASLPLQYILAIFGAGAVQGSIQWWARGHRSHHRYTDTDLDPYGAHMGLLWTHIGWMVLESDTKQGAVDTSDLNHSEVVVWQHRWYFVIALFVGLIVPWTIPGLFWGDWWGGLYFCGFLRLTLVHHSTFSVNSVAHWLGDATFDDKHSPRDHFLTALLTLGEGYHNFHHQFPMDYRNAVKWYQYDPTKWFIALCSYFGLASHLRVFPENEIQMGALSMSLKRLKEVQDNLSWPLTSAELPVISWDAFHRPAREYPLILISGFVHDVSDFAMQHPGGTALLKSAVGTDATASFFGGVYDHSHAAHNLLAAMRVGALHGGVERVVQDAIPPSQKLRIVEFGVVEGR
ncbi:delta 9-fatty acid desaturase protein [Rickenella mellea]|uniref:Acyl-CoA desaturase n=1 Tax=Rickenella mellea TaxID=50990 RepID=A0A4R5XEU9_9AGAM|nr:delta 9-fatty acid desaturase protein [Rickenella mellea]